MEDSDGSARGGAGGTAGAVGEIGELELIGEDPVPEPAGGPVPPTPRRPRGRTTLMLTAAAVLGAVAGTCTGFVIQAERPPTELPPLSQPVVPRAEGVAEPLSAAQDRQIRLDGDLRDFLIDRPKGARDARAVPGRGDGWMGLAQYANRYTDPAGTFDSLVGDDFRRSAEVSWGSGATGSVYVGLTQFRQVSNMGASEWAANGFHWADSEDDTRSWPIPGTGEQAGRVYVHDTPEREPGYLPLYSAEAHAWRGDVYMEIFVYDSEPIPKAKIMDLAKRQMGKL